MVISPLAEIPNVRFILTISHDSYTNGTEYFLVIGEHSEPPVRVSLSVGGASGKFLQKLPENIETAGKLPEIVKTPGTIISR